MILILPSINIGFLPMLCRKKCKFGVVWQKRSRPPCIVRRKAGAMKGKYAFRGG